MDDDCGESMRRKTLRALRSWKLRGQTEEGPQKCDNGQFMGI